MAGESRQETTGPTGPVFWVMLAAGWAVMGFGIRGTLGQAARTRPESFGPWFLGSALVHDLLVAPAAFALGVVIVRLVPLRLRRSVQAGLIVTAGLLAASLPLLLGKGGASGNLSALPHDYPANFGRAMIVVWLAVGLGALLGRRRRKG